MNDKLRELTLEAGPDPMDWNADDRREAVVELYEQDEKTRSPDWIPDALSELAHDDDERLALIAALKHDSPAMRHAALGIIVERGLVNFPLDSLQRMAEEQEGAWLAERRECRAEQERDSRRDSRRETDADIRDGMRTLAAQGKLP